MSRSESSTELLQLAIERVLQNRITRLTDWDDLKQSCYQAIGRTAPAAGDETPSDSTFQKIQNALIKIYLTENENTGSQRNRFLSQMINAAVHEYKKLTHVRTTTQAITKRDPSIELDDISLRARVIQMLPYAISYRPLQHLCETHILTELSRKIDAFEEEIARLLSHPKPDLLSRTDLEYVTTIKKEFDDLKEKMQNIISTHSLDPEKVLTTQDKEILQHADLKMLAIHDNELPEIRTRVFHAIATFRFMLTEARNRLESISLNDLSSDTKKQFETQKTLLKEQLEALIAANGKEINLEDGVVTTGAMTLCSAITTLFEKVETEKKPDMKYNTQGFFKEERVSFDSQDKDDAVPDILKKATG